RDRLLAVEPDQPDVRDRLALAQDPGELEQHRRAAAAVDRADEAEVLLRLRVPGALLRVVVRADAEDRAVLAGGPRDLDPDVRELGVARVGVGPGLPLGVGAERLDLLLDVGGLLLDPPRAGRRRTELVDPRLDVLHRGAAAARPARPAAGLEQEQGGRADRD